jgi:Fe-S-cluster containining protein
MDIKILEENSEFEFTCYSDCKKCCEKSVVELSPHDIVLLCKQTSLTTTEFHKMYTEFIFHPQKGIPICVLKTDPLCKFHDGQKCTVYDSRPFDCRLYPLDVEFSREGKASYFRREDICPAKEKNSWTINSWLKTQNIESGQINRFKWLRIFSNFNNPNRDDWFNRMFVLFCYDFDQPIIQSYCALVEKKIPEDVEEKTKFVFQMIEDVFIKGMIDKVLNLGGYVVG